MSEVRNATRVAQARLHNARKDEGITDLQATTLYDLIEQTIKEIEKGVIEGGSKTITTNRATEIALATKGQETGHVSHSLTSAIIAVIATEFRSAGYAVCVASSLAGGITVSLI